MISCDTYSVRDYFKEGKIDCLSVPKLLKDLGISGVTYNQLYMSSYDTEYLDKIKQACADAGVKITGFIIEGNLAGDDAQAREKQMADDEMMMRAAAYMGAPVVRINLGSTGDLERDKTEGVQRCIEAFNRLIPIAKQLNVKITIENHGGVSKTADMILDVINGTDREWVGSCLDFGNWTDDVRYTESAKLAPYAYHVHAKTHEFNDKGEDINKDYKRLLQMLKDVDYKRAVSIEYEGPDDQVEGVKKTRDLILRYWPELAD
ncbi:MAG: sugar phosphate isomerase/epimerase family protein [Armatimonadota bacterium]